MQKGKSFEQFVHIIQEALKDHSATRVFPNIKLKSKHTGRLRQFDVIIESSINSYTMRLAIECKNHGRKVEEKLIEAFNSKCDSVGDIHRKIYISNAGYQEGALQSARHFGIELHVLEEISGEKILGWINTKELYDYKFHFNISRHHLTLAGEKEDAPDYPMRTEDILNFTDGNSSTLLDFYHRIINGENNEQRLKSYMLAFVPHLKATGALDDLHKVKLSTKLNSPYAYFNVNGKRLFVAQVDLDIEIKIYEVKIESEIRNLRHPEKDEIQASIVSFPYGVDGSKIQMVFKPDSSFKQYLVNPDGSIMSELQTLAIYDPETKQYRKPEAFE